jgi:pimeloyl-ACP methyl ester carboxylesterase
MPFVEVQRGELFYEVRGDGRWLVLIHGAWASSVWWRGQISQLSRSYRLLTFDLRGHGQSSPLLEPYSMEGFAGGLEILFRHVGVAEAALVGWSLGGMVSLQYALNCPSEVKALVLVAARGNRDARMRRKILLQYLQARLSLMVNLAAPRKYDFAAETFPGERERVEAQVRGLLSPSTPPEVFAWVAADLARHPRKNYFEIAKSFCDWEPGEELKKIGTPTLILVGDQDDHTPPVCSHFLHRRIPGSKIIIVKGAGHCLPLEFPEKVNREITGFLQEAGYGGGFAVSGAEGVEPERST